MSSFSDIVFMVYTVGDYADVDGWWDNVVIEAICQEEKQAQLLTQHFPDYKYVRTNQGYVDLFNSYNGFEDYDWDTLEEFEEYCSKKYYKCMITLRNILAESEDDARGLINDILVAVDEYTENERDKDVTVEEQRW